MALKDWKKIQNTNVREVWENKKTGKRVAIVLDENAFGEQVYYPVHWSGEETGHFIAGLDPGNVKNKSQVKMALMRWMRTH